MWFFLICANDLSKSPISSILAFHNYIKLAVLALTTDMGENKKKSSKNVTGREGLIRTRLIRSST